jgi:hypothetical protein
MAAMGVMALRLTSLELVPLMVVEVVVEINSLILVVAQQVEKFLKAVLVAAVMVALDQLLVQTTETPVLQTQAVAVGQVAELVAQAQVAQVGQVL